MSVQKPLLSILIATRNRVKYCISAIETILSFNYGNFELVIQDNSDTLELEEYITKRKPDNRLIYNYTPRPFSSIDNFNAVIGHSKGEYLCLIGDDDSIHPDIFKVVEWAAKKQISSIVPTLKAIYRWPDACQNPAENGILTISSFSSKVKVMKTKSSIKRLMKNGGQDYLNLPFPKLYHGIVKRTYLEMIKKETGRYVGGLSPDIYIAIGLAKNISEFIEIDFPLTLPGICGKAAPMDERKNQYKNLEDSPHFRDRGDYFWAPEVPRFYSGRTIWADSALAAIRDLKLNKYLKHFDKYMLFSTLLDSYPDRKKEIQKYIWNEKNIYYALIVILYKQLKCRILILPYRLSDKFSFLIRNNESVTQITNLSDTRQSIDYLIKRTKELNVNSF